VNGLYSWKVIDHTWFNTYNVLIFIETHTLHPDPIPGYTCYTSALRHTMSGRGGVCIFVRDYLHTTVCVSHPDYLSINVSYSPSSTPTCIIGAYFPPHDSRYWSVAHSYEQVFEALADTINSCTLSQTSAHVQQLFVFGDFNARVPASTLDSIAAYVTSKLQVS
jgi:hypothetical protein